MRVEPIFLLVFYSLSAVTSPFMGQNFAATRYDRVAEARIVIGRFCLFFGLALAVVIVGVAEPVASLFSETDAITDIAAGYLWIMAISYGGYGLVMSICAAFNGIGNPGPGLLISILRVIVLFLPLAFAGQWLLGLHGIFAASSTSNIVVGIIGFVWFGRRIQTSAVTEPV